MIVLDGGGSCRGGVRIVQRFANVDVRVVEHARGLCRPGGRIVLQVINLKVGDGCVAGIHLMPLGDHLLREIVGPVVFVFFHLRERSAKIGVVAFAFPVAQKRQEIGDSLVGFLFVAQVAAQKIIFEKQPVLHHLKTDVLDRLHIVQGGRGGRARRVFAQHGENVDHKQGQHDRQNGPESEIKLSANRHDVRLHCMPIGTPSPDPPGVLATS